MLNRSTFRLFALTCSLGLAACTAPVPTDPGGSTGTGGGSGGAPAGTGGTPSGTGGGSASTGGTPGTGGSVSGTGGATSAGTGGTTAPGTGGSSDPDDKPDAGTPATDSGPSAPPPSDGMTFDCSLVIGIAATGQWFNAGFEKIVDGNKWELLAVHSGFVQSWADPASDFWTKAPASACTTNAKTPDRVILTALYLHWMDATVEQWVDVLTKTVMTFKAKNPNLKRLELATFIRSPGGKPCPATMAFKSFIKPEQDEAYTKVAAMFPGFVTVAPKWEVKSCADFGGNPPHFSGAGATSAAKMVADTYK